MNVTRTVYAYPGSDACGFAPGRRMAVERIHCAELVSIVKVTVRASIGATEERTVAEYSGPAQRDFHLTEPVVLESSTFLEVFFEPRTKRGAVVTFHGAEA